LLFLAAASDERVSQEAENVAESLYSCKPYSYAFLFVRVKYQVIANVSRRPTARGFSLQSVTSRTFLDVCIAVLTRSSSMLIFFSQHESQHCQ